MIFGGLNIIKDKPFTDQENSVAMLPQPFVTTAQAKNSQIRTALDLTKVTDITTTGITANPTAQGLISMLALVVNVICLCDILKTAKKKGINPYKNEIWKGTPDFEEAMDRA